MATGYPPMKKSPGKDESSHHSSPTPGDKQTPVPAPPSRNVAHPSTGKAKWTLPEPVYKHSNPAGRPKNPRG